MKAISKMSSVKTPVHKGGVVRNNVDRTLPTDSVSPDTAKKSRTADLSSVASRQPSFEDEENEAIFEKLKSWFLGQFNQIKAEIGLARTENADLKRELNEVRKEIDTNDRLIADLDAINMGVIRNYRPR
jgi:hypothetical protein